MNKDSTQKQLDALIQDMENSRLSFNAHKRFNDTINSISKNSPISYDNELFCLIDDIIFDSASPFNSTLCKDTTLYRAREIDVDDYEDANKGLSVSVSNNQYTTSGYNMANSVEAPLGIPFEGRNNLSGVSYLHVAEDQVTACTEIKSSLRSLISLAEFIVCKDLKIIDFSKDVAFNRELSKKYDISLGAFFGSLMFSFCKPDPKIYQFTQIVSDYLRKSGIDGIAYKSFYTCKTNYTIFNSHKSNIKFQNSRIISHHFTNEIFWDFNNADTLKSCNESDCNYNEEKANKILKDMKNTFNTSK